MEANWQISVGDLSEVLRPAAFALSVIASALVLADARRRSIDAPAVAAWAFLTLLFPLFVAPLYAAALLVSRPGPRAAPAQTPVTAEPGPDEFEGAAEAAPPRPEWRFALPLVYAAVLAAGGALLFDRDYRSADAHVARAKRAKLHHRAERAVGEYRAALAAEDDAHTRKLLGLELSEAGRWEEALAELSAARAGGEPDDRLPFHTAAALDALNRPAEAAAGYHQFLQTGLCSRPAPDPLCARARLRLSGGPTPR